MHTIRLGNGSPTYAFGHYNTGSLASKENAAIYIFLFRIWTVRLGIFVNGTLGVETETIGRTERKVQTSQCFNGTCARFTAYRTVW